MGRRENKRPARKALWRRCRAWLPLLAALSLAAGCGEPRPAVAEGSFYCTMGTGGVSNPGSSPY